MAYGYPTYMPQAGAYNGYAPQGQGMQQAPMPIQGGAAQSVPAMQPQQPNVLFRPVASEEEARAVPTDFSGAVTIMADFAHGRIYTKALNQNDGSSIFQVYAFQPPAPPAPPIEYAPIGTVQALAAEIEQLKQAIAAPDKPQKQAKGSAEK